MTFARAASGGFLARTTCDPSRTGIGLVDGSVIGMGELSTGGMC